jgi:hypothetical protein
MANYNLVVLAGTADHVYRWEDGGASFELLIREQNKPLRIVRCDVLNGDTLLEAGIAGLDVLVHGSLGGAMPSIEYDALPTVNVSQWEII